MAAEVSSLNSTQPPISTEAKAAAPLPQPAASLPQPLPLASSSSLEPWIFQKVDSKFKWCSLAVTIGALVSGILMVLSKKSPLPALAVFLTVPLIYFNCRSEKSRLEALKQEIIHAKDPWLAPGFSRRNMNPEPYNVIFNYLYLGNEIGFAKSCFLKCFTTNERGQPVAVDSNNQEGFKNIVTVCSPGMKSRKFDFHIVDHKTQMEHLTKSFKEHRINWFVAGRALTDSKEGWLSLVYNSTCRDGDLTDFGKEGFTEQDLDRLFDLKKQKIEAISVKDWFEAAFEVLDRGVLGSEKTLVHCAEGVSRSATLLAAYFINLFGVTADEAVAFLRTKRLCVNPKFIEPLREYATALQAARRKQI